MNKPLFPKDELCLGVSVEPGATKQAFSRMPVGPPPPPTQARGGNVFPNAPVFDHQGHSYKLYDDLIKNRVVMIQFFSIDGHQRFPASDHLAKVATRLGDRLGRDCFIYSITTEPQRDTPQRLAQFARQHGVRPGWLFLTGASNGLTAVSDRLYKHKGHAGHSKGHPARLIHYGNGRLGLWGAFGVDSDPDFAVTRLTWLLEGQGTGRELRRAGPARLTREHQQRDKSASRGAR